jgi:NADH-quinone oxidoreductase subunit C
MSDVTAAVEALVVPGSLQREPDLARRGFHVEAEATPDTIVSVAAVYRGAGYFLECLTAVDQEDYRELWYQFNRLTNEPDRHLLRVKTPDDRVPTIYPLFKAADWFEREAWDMMGIAFDGRPDMVRLLLPEDADFHPLRRDQCIDDDLRAQRVKDRTKREKAAAKAAAKEEAAKAAAEAAAAEGASSEGGDP